MTKQLLQSPTNIVLATCRTPSKAYALQAFTASSGGRLHVLRLDVNDVQSIKDAARAAAQIVGSKGIDYLVNNAGAVSTTRALVVLPCFHSTVPDSTTHRIPDQNPGGVDTAFTLEFDNLMDVFKTNLVGPAFIAQSLISLVEKSGKKTIVNISSIAGSIGMDLGEISASYAITKAGLNMLVRRPHTPTHVALWLTSWTPCRRRSRRKSAPTLP